MLVNLLEAFEPLPDALAGGLANAQIAQPVEADPVPVGTEILVNTATAGEQSGAQIANLANGGFVVIWSDASNGVGGAGGDTSGGAIKAQVYAANGIRVGSELLVNTATAAGQFTPNVTGLANGGFVVIWSDSSLGVGGATGDSSSSAVKAQVFGADGTMVGTELLVNSATAGNQSAVQATALANGGFVVTWHDDSLGVGGAGGDASSTAVKAQVFSAAGTMVGSELLVNTATSNGQTQSQTTALANGGFVVTWSDGSLGVGGATGDTSSGAVKAQVFSAGGIKLGGEILVNTATANNQSSPDITALANGGFVVTWQDDSLGVGGAGGDTSSTAVKAQVFAADGTKLGSELLINTATASSQSAAEITALNNGGFVVTWLDFSLGVGGATGDSSSSAVKAQVFGADGTRIGNELLVNTATANGQSGGHVAALANGGFVIIFTDGSMGVGGAGGDTSNNAVKAQVFAADGTRLGVELLVNTATQGFQSRPQVTALTDGGFAVAWQDNSAGVGGAGGDTSGNAIKAQIFAVSTPNAAPAGTDATLVINEDTARVLTVADFGFTDSDGDALLSVGITTLPGAGTVTLNGSAVTAGTFVTVADITAGLLVYTPGNNGNGAGYSSFTFQVRDDGGSTDTDLSANTLTFDVTGVNDAPVNTVPGAQTGTANTPLVFSTAMGNALSVADVDAGTAVMRVKLQADHGAITLAGTAGLIVTGNGTHFVLLRGSAAAINTALDGLSYLGDAGYVGTDSLSISANDRGKDGSGGSLIDLDIVGITLAAAMAPADPKAGNFAFEPGGGFDSAGLAALGEVANDPFDFAGGVDWLHADRGIGMAKADLHASDPGDFAIHALVLDPHGSAGSDFML